MSSEKKNKFWRNDKGELHREDGPACEYADGTKRWYINGKLHRIDGPAVEYPNGSKAWYIDGECHRIDGPAVENANGYKKWYINGKLHREDGPAVEYVVGHKEWWLNGKCHREDGPAIEYFDGTKAWYIDGKEYTKEEFKLKVAEMNKDKPTTIDKDGNKYWKNAEGQLHREDGPAVEYVGGRKLWYLNGQRHREDGPAVEEADGTKSWYVNGKRHRIDGPALEYADGSKQWWINGKKYTRPKFIQYLKENNIPIPNLKDLARYVPKDKPITMDEDEKGKPTEIDENGNKFWKNDEGQLHRVDGPAYEGADGTKTWYVNGQLHRVDGPAHEGADGTKEWWVNEQRHRIDGPAIEYHVGTKLWFVNGKRHRLDGPAYEGANGFKEWYLDGQRHRIDGPAVESADGRTKFWYLYGVKCSEEKFKIKIAEMNKDKPTIIDDYGNKYWYVNGRRHREDGPAIEYADGSKAWYLNGNLHREDGPAVECSDGYKAWYIDGKEYSREEFKIKVAEMNKDEPTVDKDGNKFWINDKGKYHREYGPAIEWFDGSKEWYLNGLLHRIDGPACEWSNGRKAWYVKGKLHREDGPAKEHVDGFKEWYLEGKKYTEEEFKIKVEKMNKGENDIVKNIQLEELIKRNKELEERILFLESENKKSDKTMNVLMSTGLDAFKLAGARQSTRMLVSLTKEIIKLLNSKAQLNLDFLDTEAGTAILEVIAPLIIHALATNKFIPKFSDQLELVSKMGIQANTTFYIMKYSDEITDTIKQLALNPELRTKFNDLINIPDNIETKINEPLFA